MVSKVIKETYDIIDHSILACMEDIRCFEEMVCLFVLLILKMTYYGIFSTFYFLYISSLPSRMPILHILDYLR